MMEQDSGSQTPPQPTGEGADDTRWYNALFGPSNASSPDSGEVELPPTFVGARASNITMSETHPDVGPERSSFLQSRTPYSWLLSLI